MNKIQQYRILAIAPSFRGFGYAVLEDNDTLVDWGVKTVQGNKECQFTRKGGRIDHLLPAERAGAARY